MRELRCARNRSVLPSLCEQRLGAAQHSLGFFVKESAADVASLDSKLVRTLALLTTRPGQFYCESANIRAT